MVLMSTFNGAEFIDEQIKSIRNQKNICVHLLVRDDGSTDSTIDYLKNIEILDKTSVIYGNNIGVTNSFYSLLLEASKSNFQWFSFSDQDDVWESDKSLSSLTYLKQYRNVSLYSCHRKSFGKKKQTLRPSDRYGLAKVSWFLFENPSYGNTQTFNRRLLDHYIELMNNRKEFLSVPHDLNIARFAILTSGLFIDKKILVNYRIHEKNVTGIKNGFYKAISSLSKQRKTLPSYLELYRSMNLITESSSMGNLENFLSYLEGGSGFKEFVKNCMTIQLRASRLEDFCLKLVLASGYVPWSLLGVELEDKS